MPPHDQGQTDIWSNEASVTVIGESVIDIIHDPLNATGAPQKHPVGDGRKLSHCDG